MREKLNSLGVPPEYHQHARHFVGVFKNLGWKPHQIDAAIRWGVGFQGKASEVREHFSQFAQQNNIRDADADLASAWHQQVVERGLEGMPQIEDSAAPSPEADAKRLKEIQREMEKTRYESRYWNDADMRDEYFAILERAEGGQSTTAPTSPDTARKSEIERMMKKDRAHYFRDADVQREYQQILQRETGEVPDPQSVSVSTPTQGSENVESSQGDA